MTRVLGGMEEAYPTRTGDAAVTVIEARQDSQRLSVVAQMATSPGAEIWPDSP